MNPNGRGLSSAMLIRSCSSSALPIHRLLASSSCWCLHAAQRAIHTGEMMHTKQVIVAHEHQACPTPRHTKRCHAQQPVTVPEQKSLSDRAVEGL